MSARPEFGDRGLLAATLARAEAWLLEPETDSLAEAEPPASAARGRGLRAGGGLRGHDRRPGARHGVRGARPVRGLRGLRPLALLGPAAGIGRRVAPGADDRSDRGSLGAGFGRLCLVDCGDTGRLADAARYLAPLVLDAGRDAVGGTAAALADHVVLAASSRVEPALARVARTSLARIGPEPLVVLNRASRPGPFDGVADLLLPDARMGAQLAHAGRDPRGELGRAIAELADRCEEPRL